MPSLIGLLPIPVDRSYGLTLHLPITNTDYLLTHPDLPMYRDVDHAIQRLTRSTLSPAGTSRAFSTLPFAHSNAIYTIRQAFNAHMETLSATDRASLHGITLGRMEKTYYGNPVWRGPDLDSCITLLDTPLITSSDFFDPSTLSSFPTLSVLSDSVHKRLLERFPTLEAGEPGIFGCPTVRLTPLCKNGLPKRRPGATIAAKRESILLARGSAITHTMCEEFIGTIDRLIEPLHFEGIYNRVAAFNFTPLLWLNAHKDRDLVRKKSKKTWDEMVAELHSYIKSFNHSLTLLLQWQPAPTKTQFGALRSPLIFLRKRHRRAVLDALLPFDSHLATMLNYPTQGIPHKIDPRIDAERAATYRSLRANLLRLRYAMTDGRFSRLASAYSTPAADRRRPSPTPFSRESTPSSPVEEPQEFFTHV